MEIIIVRYDDWEGLYIENELKKEGHSIGVVEAIEILIEEQNPESPFLKSPTVFHIEDVSVIEKFGWRFADKFSDYSEEDLT